MSKKKQKKMQVDHRTDVFYSNGFSVNVNDNGDIIVDFRQSLPRTDITPDKKVISTLTVKHRPVVMRPKHMKMLAEILSSNIEEFEEEHGEIELPENWRVSSKDEEEAVSKKETINETTKYIG